MTWKQSRYGYYRAHHFLHSEARELSCLPFSGINPKSGKREMLPYLNDIVIERERLYRGLINEAEYNGWTMGRFRREFINVVVNEYKDMGRILKKDSVPNKSIQFKRLAGDLDTFGMIRDYQNKAIKDGRWADYPYRKASHHKQVYDPTSDTYRNIDNIKVSQQRKERKQREQEGKYYKQEH